MRLIDADALMKTLIHRSYHVTDYWNSKGMGMFLFGIEQAINEQPTIDAVPVIRCRDCKHWYEKYRHGIDMSACKRAIGYFGANDYCSRAERK